MPAETKTTLDEATRDLVSRSVLCWLATSGSEGPSVSPKEMFTLSVADHLLIANIASPVSRKNIKAHPKVCVSVLDIFTQKGAKIYGHAHIHPEGSDHYSAFVAELNAAMGGAIPLDVFHIRDVIEVIPATVQPIIAPSYRLIAGRTEADMREAAYKTYGVTPLR